MNSRYIQGSALTVPQVTVLMAVHNDGRYLGRAIESILGQSYSDFEFLIINDGSTDNSREIIQTYQDPRIRLVDNPTNIGLTRSLNRGLELARGSLIARFDSNDISYPDRIEKQLAFMELNRDVAAVGGQVRGIDVNGRRLRGLFLRKPVTQLGIQWYMMFGSPLNHPAVMFRRQVVWLEFSGYDESWIVGQDAELWSRISTRYSLANLSDVMVDFRLDPSSISGNLTSGLRAGHPERMERLFRSNMSRYLKIGNVPVEWSRLAIGLCFPTLFVDAGLAQKHRGLLESVYSRFIQVNPEAASNVEVKRHMAEAQSGVASELATRKRMASVRAFLGACSADLAIARKIPKFIALLVAGETGRRSWRRWRYRNRPMKD